MWPSSLEGHFYDNHVRKVGGSTPTQASFCVVASLDKMLHDNYLCLVEFSKQKIEEVRSKTRLEHSKTKTTPKQVWIDSMHSTEHLRHFFMTGGYK